MPHPRLEFGDFQTPPALAARVCSLLANQGWSPRSVVEPTCGEGAFLLAALEAFRPRQALAMDIDDTYVRRVRRRVHGQATVRKADFFRQNWNRLLDDLAEPILVIGNPPWVTNAAIGSIKGRNLPEKTNAQRLRGVEAITGKSNFDISEWMLNKLVDSLKNRQAALAMLCKRSTARKVLRHAWEHQHGISGAAIYGIDARHEFGAAVDACLLVIQLGMETEDRHQCDVYESLDSTSAHSTFGLIDGRLIADRKAYHRHHSTLGGPDHYCWRSGVKHDCSKVMEFVEDGAMYNGLGESVDIEPDRLFPMLKSSELTHGKTKHPRRWMLVTQSHLGEDTARLKENSPKTWNYLNQHAGMLGNRRSSIYRNKPPFSVFGVGPYTFSPWKVAVASLYKQMRFSLLGKHRGKPIVVDDTCYMLACETRNEARQIVTVLNSADVVEYLSAFIFWDSKRPITRDVLQQLALEKVAFGDCRSRGG